MPQELSLQKFINTLSTEIYQLSLDDLRRAVMDYANGLAPSARAEFVALFASKPERQVVPTLRPEKDTESLLSRITDLKENLEQGVYFQGYGWDEDIYEERSFGDDSWAAELTELFIEADGIFDSGHLSVARNAYERLFEILDLDEEVGTFTGSETPVDMLDLDITESQKRYLRCVYELADPDSRATEFELAWFSLVDFSDQLTLQGVDECRVEGLPEFGDFLPGWINVLQARMGGSFINRERELLVEATLFHGGLPALGELAHHATVAQAELYLDWILTLVAMEENEQAVTAAQEALERLGEPGTTRAKIADELANLSNDNPLQALEAKRQAFRSEPNLHRLIWLYRAEEHFADPKQQMKHEAARLQESSATPRISQATSTALQLLAGNVQSAIDAVQNDARHGSRVQDGQRVLLPYLLTSGLEDPQALPVRGSWLAELHRCANEAESYTWNLRSTNLNTRTSTEQASSERRDPNLSDLLLRTVIEENLSAGERTERIGVAEALIAREVELIVSTQQRALYDLAANLIISRVEVGYLNNETSDAEQFATMLAAKFPRHRAFQQELVDSRKRSKILTRS